MAGKMGFIGKYPGAYSAGRCGGGGYVAGAGKSDPFYWGCAEGNAEELVAGGPFENGGATVVLMQPDFYVWGSEA